jgi:hypothetical protein
MILSSFVCRIVYTWLMKLSVVCVLGSHHLSIQTNKQTPWPEPASELYRPNDRRLIAMLVPTFADREYHVVSVTDPYGRILGFLDQNRYFFFKVAPQFYSRG